MLCAWDWQRPSTYDGNHLASAAPQVLQTCRDGGLILVPADDGRRKASHADVAALGPARRPGSVCGDRAGEALRRERIEALGLQVLGEEAAGRIAHRDALADGLQAPREVRHLAGRHEIVHRPAGCRRVPCGDTDPKDEARPALLLEHGVELGQALLHGGGSAHGAFGVILVDPRHTEDGHDGVAGELLDGATEGLDLLTHLIEEGQEECAEVLGILLGGERGRPHEIGEENRDRFALVAGGHRVR